VPERPVGRLALEVVHRHVGVPLTRLVRPPVPRTDDVAAGTDLTASWPWAARSSLAAVKGDLW